MTFDRGDVVVLPLAHTDGQPGKRRPALVLSDRAYNEGEDLIVCAITSNQRATQFSVLLEPQDMTKPHLPKTSRIKVGRIAAVEKTLVQQVLGRVKPPVMAQVWKEFHSLFPT